MPNREQILKIRDLSVSFTTANGIVKAVRGFNMDVYKGETVAIVGESGSGKSVTVKEIMGIHAPNEIIGGGSIEFTYSGDTGGKKTVDLLKMNPREIQNTLKGKHIAMVFQDPMTSLDPTMNIGRQLAEGMVQHLRLRRAEAKKRAAELLRIVGIKDPEKRMKNYPHQLSGGMRQRVVIAMAISCEPDLLICDEPTTALDVTIQARILQLIMDLQARYNISVIFITHNLGVVAKVADYVNVMYAGKIVETGKTDDIFFDPRHPYTWGLLSSVPDLSGDRAERLYTIRGNPPNLLNEINGDAFAPRNPFSLEIDFEEEPPMFTVNSHHQAATWLLDPRSPAVEVPPQIKRRIEDLKKECAQDAGR
ncbi:MAG: ABC transporter ATP-binding protein [Bacillota bacterium]|nr:ABC transporter ATP-binding protein [Bacillota bacterium]